MAPQPHESILRVLDLIQHPPMTLAFLHHARYLGRFFVAFSDHSSVSEFGRRCVGRPACAFIKANRAEPFSVHVALSASLAEADDAMAMCWKCCASWS